MTKKQIQNPTMNDVAKEAGVSVATVSRVINGSDEVSQKLQRRVEIAMRKLQYHPSSLARSFKMQETRLIGLVVPLLDHPFFSRLTQVMEQELFRNNYRTIICNTEDEAVQELEYVEMLLRQRVDGVIINSAIDNTDYLFQLQTQQVPCVLIDRDIELVRCSKVFSDNSLGGYLGMKYLLEQGHRYIQVVTPFDFRQPIQHRIQGIREALAEFDIDEAPDMFMTSGDPSFEMGVRAGKKLAKLSPCPTAIFALTDVTAIGILHGLAQMGLKVPDDISVMGYDGIPLSGYVMPTLTTVAQPITDMAKKAVSILLKHIQNPELPPDRAVLPNQLIIRESTAPPQRSKTERSVETAGYMGIQDIDGCPYCQSTDNQVKIGRTEAGSQRYKCKNCQRKYTPNPKQVGYSDELRRKAVRLYEDGVNFRQIGRRLGVNHQTVINWITAYEATITGPSPHHTGQ